VKSREEIERARQLFKDLVAEVDGKFPDRWFAQILAAQGGVLEWVLDSEMGYLFERTLQSIADEIVMLKSGMLTPEDLIIANRPIT
jgi:hypothetical protein